MKYNKYKMNLIDKLKAQLNTDFKTQAEECIKIYNKLKELTGHVWASEFYALVKYGYSDEKHKHIYFPSKTGKIFLKGLS